MKIFALIILTALVNNYSAYADFSSGNCEKDIIERRISFDSANPRNFQDIISKAILNPVRLTGDFYSFLKVRDLIQLLS